MIYENYHDGYNSEKNLFRIIDATVRYDNKGIKVKGNKNSNKLFFESYSEFEKFYKIGGKKWL